MRQKQKEEEAWQADMQKKQKAADKLWNDLNAAHEKMNILHESMNTAETDEERKSIDETIQKANEEINKKQ